MSNPQMVMYEEEFQEINVVIERLLQEANAKVIFDFVDKNDWIANLAKDPATRSNTSVCLTIADKDVLALDADATSPPVRAAAFGQMKAGAVKVVGGGDAGVEEHDLELGDVVGGDGLVVVELHDCRVVAVGVEKRLGLSAELLELDFGGDAE